MKNYLARAAVALVVLLGASTAEAQYSRRSMVGFEEGETLLAVNWEISAPIADFKNFISDWSLRGFSVEGRHMISNRLSLGGSFSWNRWSQTYGNALVDVPNGNISGPLYRYADMFGLRALAHYYFTDGVLQPYFGVGIGGVWAYSYQQVVDLAWSHDSFNFIVDPEIGLLYQLTSGSTSLHLNIAVRYTFTTATLINNKGSNLQWLTLPVVGLAWSY